MTTGHCTDGAAAARIWFYEEMTYDHIPFPRYPYGGPDLLGGTNIVLSVNSFETDINCSGVGYSSRVDIPKVLDWIYSFMP